MLGAARRIRVGRLTVILPDGQRHAFGDPVATDAAEIRIHDTAAVVRMLLGRRRRREAYVDGLWSSPDLPRCSSWPVETGRRSRCPTAGGACRCGSGGPSPIAAAGTRSRAAAATSKPITTWERLLPAVPRRDVDLLECGLRRARRSAGRRPASQIRGDGGARGPRRRRARARDRQRLGRLRAVCRGRARVSRDHRDDLAVPAPPGDGTDPGGRPRRPGQRRAARLPRHRRHL